MVLQQRYAADFDLKVASQDFSLALVFICDQTNGKLKVDSSDQACKY